jgi:hypothetical protein
MGGVGARVGDAAAALDGLETSDHKSFETTLHDRFAAYRGLGEWFSADEVLSALIDEASAGRSRTDHRRRAGVA